MADLKTVVKEALVKLNEVLEDLETGEILSYQRRNRLKLEVVQRALKTIEEGLPK